MKYPQFAVNAVVFFFCCLQSGFVVAGCSSFIGQASINEVYRSKNGPDEGLIEIKLINASIPVSTFSTWSIRVCEGGGPSCVAINLTDADTSSSPWLVFDEGDFSTGLIDFRDGFDIVLSDGPNGTGDAIDYLNVEGFSHQSPGCTFSYDTNITNTTNGTKFIQRDPDGSGSWLREQSNSVDPTEGETNGGSAQTVAEWRFDESDWPTGAAVDSSGNGRDGQPVGATSGDVDRARAGTPGTCAYGVFDGSGDYVDFGNSTDFDMSTALTLTAWVKAQAGTTKTILSKGGTFIIPFNSYTLRLNSSSQLEFLWCDDFSGFFGSCSSLNTITSTTSLTSGQWTHVAISFSSTEQTLYIDGVAVSPVGSASTGIDTNTGDIRVGGMESLFAPNYFMGSIDEVRLYDATLTDGEILTAYYDTRDCPVAGIDHYAVSFDGGVSNSDADGLTCQPANVTITAHDAGHTAVVPSDAVTIALQADSGQGSWSLPSGQPGTLADTGGDGADYTFGSANDTVTLSLHHSTAVPLTIDIATNAEQEDPTLTFRDTGFRFVDGSDNLIGSSSNPFHQVSATSSGTFYLEALRTDGMSGSCVGAFNSATTVPVDLGAECNNPSTCAGKTLVLNNNGTNHTLVTSDDNGGSASAAYSNDLAIQFDDASRASLTMSYVDVGALSLHAKYDIPNADSSDSLEDMLGSSEPIVFKPAAFTVVLVEDSAGNENVGSITPGSGFLPAASPFTVRVDAVNADNDLTPNYGNEDGAGGSELSDSAEGLVLNVTSLIYPTGPAAENGSLSNASAFTRVSGAAGGFENTTITWDEVGSFRATASVSDGNYLGAGSATGTESETIGLFYPAYFGLASGSVVDACSTGSFTYMEQPAFELSYTITAYNLDDDPVTNYDNTNANAALNYSTASVSLLAENNDDGVDLSTRISPSAAVAASRWNNGVLIVADTASQFIRSAGLDGPFSSLEFGLSLDEADGTDFNGLDFSVGAGACCDALQLGGSLNLRHGRLFLQDVHGPESEMLSVPFRSEYWNNGFWVLNTDDSCTELPNTAIEFDGEAISINRTVNVDGAGGDDTTGSFAVGNVNYPLTTVDLAGGDAELFFGAPGVQGSFPITVDLSDFPWLLFDWDQDGEHNALLDSNMPRATVTYGRYRGHDRVIYWQERLQ